MLRYKTGGGPLPPIMTSLPPIMLGGGVGVGPHGTGVAGKSGGGGAAVGKNGFSPGARTNISNGSGSQYSGTSSRNRF